MHTHSLAFATVLLVSVSGAALAQAGTAGSTEKNLNNPGSVKSNSEKGMPAKDGVITTSPTASPAAGTSTGATKVAPGASTKQGTSATGVR